MISELNLIAGDRPRACRPNSCVVIEPRQAKVPADPRKGSHRKFRHPKFSGFVLISGHDGDDAHPYQEKQVRNALRWIQS
jgi:HicA-like toxin of HicAB toxin-antitoxin system